MWPVRRPHLEFDDADYEQEVYIESHPVRYRNSARSRVHPFIDAEAGVVGNASGDDGPDHENAYLDGFIVAYYVDY